MKILLFFDYDVIIIIKYTTFYIVVSEIIDLAKEQYSTQFL